MADPIVVPPPPAARRESVSDRYHGVEVSDPYRWLEDATSTETILWVTEQNARTRQALDAIGSYNRWHERLLALLGTTFTWPVARVGDRLFLAERTGTQPQPIYYVTAASDASAERRMLLDTGSMAEDGAVALDWLQVSRDGELMAYGVSEGGTENSTLQVMNVETGELLADRIPNTRACSLSWFPDNTGFWYTRYPQDDQYHRMVYRHVLGQDWSEDVLVWGDLPVADAWPSVQARKDGAYLLVSVGVGWSRHDLHLLNVGAGTWTTIHEGADINTYLAFEDDHLVGFTNMNAPRSRVVSMALAAADLWTTLVPESDLVIEGAWRSSDRRFVTGMRSGVRVLQQHDLEGGLIEEIPLPSFSEFEGSAIDWDEPDFFVSLSSFAQPSRLYRWSPTCGIEPWGAVANDAPFDPSTIEVERLTYPSLDGTEVGMYVVRAASTELSPATPMWLRGYGGFNIASTPSFSSSFVAWCEAGGAIAIAGIRGGNEEGEDWHNAGMRANKQNVFNDFAAAADFLVRTGRSSRDRLAIHGGSNGGLLVGAVMTQRPDLCAAVVCEVPLLDMIRFPEFLIARLWTHEYGDPAVAEEFGWLHAYSPYHHVSEGVTYPATLFTTAEGDTRVDPLHARKMAAMVQWATAGKGPILLRQGGRAGHGAGRPTAKIAADAADVLTFLGWQLALDCPQK